MKTRWEMIRREGNSEKRNISENLFDTGNKSYVSFFKSNCEKRKCACCSLNEVIRVFLVADKNDLVILFQLGKWYTERNEKTKLSPKKKLTMHDMQFIFFTFSKHNSTSCLGL